MCVYLKRFYRKDINSYLLIHPMDEICFLKLKIRHMYVTEPKQQVSKKKQMISYDCKSDWCTYRIKIHCKLQNLQRVQSQHSKIMPWWTCVRLELKRSLAFICNLNYKHFTIAWISKIVMIRKRPKLITSSGTDQISKHISYK